VKSHTRACARSPRLAWPGWGARHAREWSAEIRPLALRGRGYLLSFDQPPIHPNSLSPLFTAEPPSSSLHPDRRDVSAFRDRGVPKPTSECAACPSPDGSSAWASAKGGEARRPEPSVREVEVPRPSCSSLAQVRCACSRGVTSVHAGEGSERPQESACPVLGPARPTFFEKALVLPFIVVRRGSRCTMGM
jgi:hypothetical protein